jgi:hypothetical protein
MSFERSKVDGELLRDDGRAKWMPQRMEERTASERPHCERVGEVTLRYDMGTRGKGSQIAREGEMMSFWKKMF